MKERNFNVEIEYHADDFGMFIRQSRRILDCHRNGSLNGISVMPNSPELEACMELLEPYKKDIAVTIHLNLIEGQCVSAPENVPFLVDGNGIFCATFGNLLARSFLPGRDALRKQLKQELRAQILKVKGHLEAGCPLRLDGHAHYHMIPVVFDALMDVIREDQLDVSYIRIPRECVAVYWKNLTCLQGLSFINAIKVAILQLLSNRNRKKYCRELSAYEKKLFMGVALSGHMFRENVELALPDLIKIAQKEHCGIEILAHPGGVFEQDDIARLTNKDDIDFLTDPLRDKEAGLFCREVLCEV